MSDNTSIEWTDTTWNPVTGCTEVTPGCDNCYAKTFAERWRGIPGHPFERGFDVVLRPERVAQPLTWRKPRKVFVNSMSDLFHDQVPDEFIAQVFSVMARTPEHTYQLLTKRHGRMRSLLNRPSFRDAVAAWGAGWPLRNLWIGVSVEDQQRANLRIPALIDTPAWIRWLSCEPLLGPVDLARTDKDTLVDGGIDWVVVGGESGPGARPMHPDWARNLRDQCRFATVPFFFKQWGEWAPAPSNYGPDVPARARPSTRLVFTGPTDVDGQILLRRGKKAAGRELDGRTWDEYPTAPRGITATAGSPA
jgi:protein gp37